MEEKIENLLGELDTTVEVPLNEEEIVEQNGTLEVVSDNSDWAEKTREFETTISNLRDELTKKTDVAVDLEQQKGSLVREVTQVSWNQFEFTQPLIHPQLAPTFTHDPITNSVIISA